MSNCTFKGNINLYIHWHCIRIPTNLSSMWCVLKKKVFHCCFHYSNTTFITRKRGFLVLFFKRNCSIIYLIAQILNVDYISKSLSKLLFKVHDEIPFPNSTISGKTPKKFLFLKNDADVPSGLAMVNLYIIISHVFPAYSALENV